MQRLDNKSRMSGDVHVRFRERLEGKFLWATRLVKVQLKKGKELIPPHTPRNPSGSREKLPGADVHLCNPNL